MTMLLRDLTILSDDSAAGVKAISSVVRTISSVDNILV